MFKFRLIGAATLLLALLSEPNVAATKIAFERALAASDITQHQPESTHMPAEPEHTLKAERQRAGYTCSDEIAGWTCPDLQDQVDAGSVEKGVYLQCAVVSRRVDFNESWLKQRVCSRKAALIARDGAVIENVKITDVSIGINATCVRWEGGDVTLRNVTCRRADMGLLGFGENLVIEDSRFARTLDRGQNHGHLLYTCVRQPQSGRLVIRESELRAPGDEGHVVKTGCAVTRIERSTLDGADANYSRVIDAFNGGHLIIVDSTLAAGRTGGNGDLIGYGAETRAPLPRHRVELRGGRLDCVGLPIWGNALHTFPDRVWPAEIVWEPAETIACPMPQ